MRNLGLLAATVLVATTTLASARDYRYNDPIDQRQYNQERRIQDGLRDGSLTRREYRALETEQARIRELERQAKRDGVLTWRERQEIKRAQNEANRHIYQERHDNQRRWWRLW